MYKIPRFLSKHIPGFQIIDVKEYPKKGFIEVHLKKDEENKARICSRCICELKESHGKCPVKLKIMTIFNYDWIFKWIH